MPPMGHPASSKLYHKWDANGYDEGQDELRWNSDRSPFDPNDPLPSAFWGNDQMTWLDSTSFAKDGGNAKGGGKNSGGGGETSTPPPPPPPDSGIVGTYYAGLADGEAGYDIRIDFKGTGWTDGLKKGFMEAADYFTSVITADIGGGKYYNNIYVDDLYMTAELKPIDGAGGILGQAGPTAIWSPSELTATGLMQFDSADAVNYLNNGLWDDIITHEMMHVLGFGSLWNYGANPLVPTTGQYTGAKGLAAYQAAGHPGATYIPVQTSGGSGTAGSHWSEAALGNELMTPYLNGTNYLSNFSLMSLADLGYSVNPLPWSGNPIG
jgi:Leishmanolysin